MTEPGVVVLWRCTGCGRWSTAKRRPRAHQRFIAAGRREAEAVGFTVIDEREPIYGYESIERDGGVMVACGPFEAWEARRKL